MCSCFFSFQLLWVFLVVAVVLQGFLASYGSVFDHFVRASSCVCGFLWPYVSIGFAWAPSSSCDSCFLFVGSVWALLLLHFFSVCDLRLPTSISFCLFGIPQGLLVLVSACALSKLVAIYWCFCWLLTMSDIGDSCSSQGQQPLTYQLLCDRISKLEMDNQQLEEKIISLTDTI